MPFVKLRMKVTKRKCSLGSPLFEKSPFFKQELSGKASLCVFTKVKKASLTVETALVLPLFFFGMITFISFMDVYKVQTEHLSQLCESAKAAGMYAYTGGENSLEKIVLPDIYSYEPVSGIFPLPSIRMRNIITVHAWTGKERVENQEASETEPMVYVAVSGTVYHKDRECSYLRLTVTSVSGSSISGRRNAYGEKYKACESCSKKEAPGAQVYITEYGNRYHNHAECSGLKRTVRMIKESEAGNLHSCSRCG